MNAGSPRSIEYPTISDPDFRNVNCTSRPAIVLLATAERSIDPPPRDAGLDVFLASFLLWFLGLTAWLLPSELHCGPAEGCWRRNAHATTPWLAALLAILIAGIRGYRSPTPSDMYFLSLLGHNLAGIIFLLVGIADDRWQVPDFIIYLVVVSILVMTALSLAAAGSGLAVLRAMQRRRKAWLRRVALGENADFVVDELGAGEADAPLFLKWQPGTHGLYRIVQPSGAHAYREGDRRILVARVPSSTSGVRQIRRTDSR